MRPTRPVTTAVPLVLASWLVAACGSEQAATDPTGPASTASSRPTTGGNEPMESTDPTDVPGEDPTVVPTGKPGTGSRVTLSGTVEPGVEAGCHLLTAGGSTYQLIWDRGEILDGQRVEVFGAVEPDLMTTCQQGIPLVVERLTSG